MFCCFKRNDKREVKVAQLAGSVAEMSAYHHGEVSFSHVAALNNLLICVLNVLLSLSDLSDDDHHRSRAELRGQ